MGLHLKTQLFSAYEMEWNLKGNAIEQQKLDQFLFGFNYVES